MLVAFPPFALWTIHGVTLGGISGAPVVDPNENLFPKV